MPYYTIRTTYIEQYQHDFQVEANSPEEAVAKINRELGDCGLDAMGDTEPECSYQYETIKVSEEEE